MKLILLFIKKLIYKLFVFVADRGYTPSPVLLTAVENAIPGTPEYVFSHNLRRARCKVEQLFGIWKQVWRCIHKERSLHYEPEFAAEIVQACAILHNFLRRQG